MATGAHGTLFAAAHQMLGDVLGIESAARIRLADEYDEAQGRGNPWQTSNGLLPSEIATLADLGINRVTIHRWR